MTKKKQHFLHECVLRNNLSVRETEQAAQRMGDKIKSQIQNVPRDFHLESLVELIREKFGTQVSILTKGNKGQICFDYYCLEDLDRLLELFGIHLD